MMTPRERLISALNFGSVLYGGLISGSGIKGGRRWRSYMWRGGFGNSERSLISEVNI